MIKEHIPNTCAVIRYEDSYDGPCLETAHPGDAAYDVYVHRLYEKYDMHHKFELGNNYQSINLYTMQRAKIGLGFRLAMDSGWVAKICSRSGLALKHGLIVANAPGIVDSSYRGEVCAILLNLGLTNVRNY